MKENEYDAAEVVDLGQSVVLGEKTWAGLDSTAMEPFDRHYEE